MCLAYISIVLLALAAPSFVLAADPDSSSAASPLPSPISWQSAFLGLVPLALNAMTQPSSLDTLFSQSSLLFPFRSSPFICLADALEVLISLIIHLCHGNSIRQAALLVNWQRARCRFGQDVEELEDSPAEKHPIPFGILFVGTVLQAVKIFGFRGLVWTQFWAGSYLSSFVVIALVGFLAPKDWRENPPEIVLAERDTHWTFDNLSKVLMYTSLVAHFVCCSWILDRIIPGNWPSPMGLWMMVMEAAPGFVAALILLSLAALYWCALYGLFCIWETVESFVGHTIFGWPRPTRAALRPFVRYCLVLAEIFLILCLPGCVAGCCFLLQFFSEHDFDFLGDNQTEAPARVIWAVMCFIRGGGNLLLSMYALRKVRNSVGLLDRRIPSLKRLNTLVKSHGNLVVFACWTFLEALLYYRFRYDPQGTVKPSWTDNLG